MKTKLATIALAVASVALLVPSLAGADAVERVTNGGFETGTGSAAPPWTFNDAQACGACGPLPASEGSRYASTGVVFEQAPPNSTNTLIGEFSQTVLIPENPFRIAFDMRRVESGEPVDIHLRVKLDGVEIAVYSNTDIPTAFGRFSFDTPSGSTSASPQTLEFEVVCDNPAGIVFKDCDRIDVDDVSLVTGTPPGAPTITGTTPPSPADNDQPFVKGTLGAGNADTVRIFRGPNCDDPIASGPASEFTGSGIRASVEENTTTTITAQAINLAGPSPCSNAITYREFADTQPPTLQLSGKRSQKLAKVVRVGARCTNEPCTLAASGKLTATFRRNGRRIKRTFRLRQSNAFVQTGQRHTLKPGISRKARRAARRALRRGGRVTASVLVTALDEEDNRTRKTRSVRLR